MAEKLKVKTKAVKVTMCLATGTVLTGKMFVSEREQTRIEMLESGGRVAHVRLSDELSEDEPFIKLVEVEGLDGMSLESGQSTIIINKRHIVWAIPFD